MSTIRIQRQHQLPLDELRLRLEALCDKLQRKLEVSSEWQSDFCLSFRRSGAQGNLEFDQTSLQLTLRLGLMWRALKTPIEREINQVVDQYLGEPGGSATAVRS